MWLWRILFVVCWVVIVGGGLLAVAIVYFWRYVVPLLVLYVVFRVWRLRRQRATVPRQ